MALAGVAAEEGTLGTRPSHDLVKASRKAVSRIESELAWKIKAIAALSNPPDMDISLCEAAKAAMEAEAKRIAEEEKAPHRSVIQLEEFYQMYDNIIKKSENSGISKTEAYIKGNKKLDIQQLLHELNRLILFNLPDSAQKLSTIGKLDLSNNNMKSLTESVTSLVNLRTLDVHSNQLTSLPQSMGKLQKLKILNISGNFFAELPESVQNCRSLEELMADFNKLQRLPETIGIKLFNLQKLSVHSNQLSYLPSSISCLMSLRVLDVHMNKLRYLPEDIDNLSIAPAHHTLDQVAPYHVKAMWSGRVDQPRVLCTASRPQLTMEITRHHRTVWLHLGFHRVYKGARVSFHGSFVHSLFIDLLRWLRCNIQAPSFCTGSSLLCLLQVFSYTTARMHQLLKDYGAKSVSGGSWTHPYAVMFDGLSEMVVFCGA